MHFIRHSIAAACIVIAGSAIAQGTQIALGGLNANPSDPVEVNADSLTVNQDNGTAIFTGNVVIGQGSMRLAAARVQVRYSDTNGDITQLLATGGVTLVTETEAAEAVEANYNLETGMLVLTGNVLLTQGPSAISADRMNVNLETGTAQMEGRVRTVFAQGDN
ncbi:lipopolysaccharide transport periplasmic protein LptA [Aestuariibius sp. HNIBRBA575]|uniref:lipopolysaccharide transport periplasmic protein LptA n=1 Tax=Aestuariibius sp. HNIBRBA575 TaxID=3233343 RepID=UPI0034A20B51